MKILHTVNRYHPEVGGSEEAVRQISERLVRLGHEVTVATGWSARRTDRLLNGVIIREFRCGGDRVGGFHGAADEYRRFLREEKFDVMMNYGAQIWCTDIAFEQLPAMTAKKVLVPCCYYRLKDHRYHSYFGELPDNLRQYDGVIYFSERNDDCRFAREHGLVNGVQIPNGADPDAFSVVPRGAFRRRLHIGDEVLVIDVSNHGWLKNHDFFWQCVPSIRAIGARPVLVGEPYRPAPRKWIKECYPLCRLSGLRHHVPVLEGCSRQVILEAFVDADVFLFGSRYECSPLVMFEAFATGTLFITTDCGNVADMGDVARIVQNEKEAVEVIREFVRDRSQFQPQIERGRNLIRNTHNWDAVTRQYESLYRRLLSGTRA